MVDQRGSTNFETPRPNSKLQDTYTGWSQEFRTMCLYALTLSNINLFTKLSHCQNQKKICQFTHYLHIHMSHYLVKCRVLKAN